jgi:hypothetical protein
MTRAQLLEDLLVERFTHLPQSSPASCDAGPTFELMLARRQDDAVAAHVVTAFRPRPAAPAPDLRSAKRATS